MTRVLRLLLHKPMAGEEILESDQRGEIHPLAPAEQPPSCPARAVSCELGAASLSDEAGRVGVQLWITRQWWASEGRA